MEKEAIIKKLNDGLSSLYAVNGDLIKNKANEETIATHLTGCLELVFLANGWRVNTRYNRDSSESKKNRMKI